MASRPLVMEVTAESRRSSARRLLRLGRGGGGSRTVTAGPDRPPVGDRDPRLPPAPVLKRQDRNRQPHRRNQRRAAHGYRNFTNYRLRLLLHHGVKWDTQTTTRIRGRRPRWSRKPSYPPPGGQRTNPARATRHGRPPWVPPASTITFAALGSGSAWLTHAVSPVRRAISRIYPTPTTPSA